jgi:hypothetical protein
MGEEILKQILKQIGCEGRNWPQGSGQGPRESSCEHGNESSDCMKGRAFLNQLSNYELLKDSAQCH